MKTKSILSLVLLLSIHFSIQAQSLKEEMALMQSVFGMEKKAMVAEFMGDNVNDEFWAIYDEYETARKELGVKRLALIEKYAKNYESMSEEVINDMVKSMQNQKKSLDKLIDKYSAKVRKASGGKAAAQFYQFENYLLAAVRVSIFNNIPLIGELDPKY